jgi:N-acetylmuramoyl-L-alanine amidase
VVTPAGVQNAPTVIRVRIEPADSAFYLFRFDAAGRMVADTWHRTEEEAKSQAKWEYEINDSDWRVATDPDHNGPYNPGAIERI